MVKYTPKQTDRILNNYFRDNPRPTPWPRVAEIIGVDGVNGLDAHLWKVATGYGGNDPDGPRREYVPTRHRLDREGYKWYPREDSILRAILAGEGQRRQPPCDMAHAAAVLARPIKEIEKRWRKLNPVGFGFKG